MTNMTLPYIEELFEELGLKLDVDAPGRLAREYKVESSRVISVFAPGKHELRSYREYFKNESEFVRHAKIQISAEPELIPDVSSSGIFSLEDVLNREREDIHLLTNLREIIRRKGFLAHFYEIEGEYKNDILIMNKVRTL